MGERSLNLNIVKLIHLISMELPGQEMRRDYLIDTDGEIVRCLDYENLAGVYCKPDKRFMNINLHDLNGLYDTKSRKMVFEPMNADYLELEDEIVVVQYRGEDYKDIYYIE